MDHRAEVRPCPHCGTSNRVSLTKRALACAHCGRCGLRLALTYYDLLGVSPTASASEIKHAYRRLAGRWHPDRNRSPDAAAVFTYLTEAYRTLADPERRRRYDETLRDGPAAPASSAADPSAAEPASTEPASTADRRKGMSGQSARGQAEDGEGAGPGAHGLGGSTAAADRRFAAEHSPGSAVGLAAEVARFGGVTAASFLGLVEWAVHHAAYPLLCSALFAASCGLWTYGLVALLHFVATGRRLHSARRAKVSARMERL